MAAPDDGWTTSSDREEAAKRKPATATNAALAQALAAQKAKNDAGKPVAPEWKSLLNDAGFINGTYAMPNPANVKASKLDVADITGPGTLNAHQLGDLQKVGIQSVLPDAQARLDKIQLDPRGMEAFRQRALETGPSAWLNLAKERQGLDEQTALESSAKNTAGATSNALSGLAMRGGLHGGAALRAAKDSSMQAALQAQQIRRGGMGDRMGLEMADNDTKTKLLSQLPGAELAWAQPEMDKARMLTGVQMDEQGRKLAADTTNSAMDFDKQKYNTSALTDADKYNLGMAYDVSKTNLGKNLDLGRYNTDNDLKTKMYNTDKDVAANQFNISNSLNEVTQGRLFDSNNFNQQMQSWAAGKTADAQSKGGKK